MTAASQSQQFSLQLSQQLSSQLSPQGSTASSPEVLVLGGGLMGGAIALELRQRGARVTVLSRDAGEAAGFAGAGMLAPQAEGLPLGPMLDLCLRSRSLYPAWCRALESLTGLPTGYWPTGILSPVYDGEVALSPQDSVGSPAMWLEREALREFQPGLSAAVRGAWWFPKDGQVDCRRQLMRAMRRGCELLGVNWCEGVSVLGLQCQGDRVMGVVTDQGVWSAQDYVWAMGAWSGLGLPALGSGGVGSGGVGAWGVGCGASLPVRPRKGQLLAVQTPVGGARLERVLFGRSIYVVPRRDGLIVVGATSELAGFVGGNTGAGVEQLLREAVRLYPPMAAYPVVDRWWGYRPETLDENPILGPSAWENLALATGHYRNGILLTPITAQVIADWVLLRQGADDLAAFRWDRFAGAKFALD